MMQGQAIHKSNLTFLKPSSALEALALLLNAWAVEQGAQVFGGADGDGEFACDALLESGGESVEVEVFGECAAVD